MLLSWCLIFLSRKSCWLWVGVVVCLVVLFSHTCSALDPDNLTEEPLLLTQTDLIDNPTRPLSQSNELVPGLRHLSRRNFDDSLEESYTYTSTALTVVATVDGAIHGLDKRTGDIKWSQTNLGFPLVSSHNFLVNTPYEEALSDVLEEEEEFEESEYVQPRPEERVFIPEPGGSGNLYYFSTHSRLLKKFPITIKKLIDQTPFRFQKRIYLAEKKTDFIVLDAFTGEILQKPGSSKFTGSKSTSLRSGTSGFQTSARGVVLGYATYDIKVYDELTEELKWNITLTDYRSDMLAQSSPSSTKKPPTYNIPVDKFSTPVIFAFDVVREESAITRWAGSLVTRTIPFSTFSAASSNHHMGSAFLGYQNGSVYVLTPKLFPYLPNSKFFHKQALLNDSPNSDLILHPGNFFTDGHPTLADLIIEGPEPLLGLPGPSYSLKRWLWALMITLITICGLQEVYSYYFVRKPQSKSNSRKSKSQKKGTNLSSSSNSPLKAITLENGSTLVGSITVTQEILGYGSHGTIVFRGQFQNREVAVKRMLIDLVNVAEHEVQTLEDSDDHPFVIRYYAMERCDRFMYLALELCPTSLQGLIEESHKLSFPVKMTPQQILYQMMSGLHHLHQLKIVHRDIKPQNILLGNSQDRFGQIRSSRMLISDFGLCKRLEEDQSSFHNTILSGGAAGTMGWRAPECLVNPLPPPQLVPPASDSEPSSGSIRSVPIPINHPTKSTGRTTRALDIFSMGCVFYYVLSHGRHPFGERYVREGRVIEGNHDLTLLIDNSDITDGFDAHDLIKQMLDPDPSQRPDSITILLHPYFWDASKKLNFLQDISDQLEGELRMGYRGDRLDDIEEGADLVLGGNWLDKMDRRVLNDIQKFRGYDGLRIRDLLRVIRNKKHHYADLPPYVQRVYGSPPDGFLTYFLSRFPALLLHVYYHLARHPTLPHTPIFRPYFHLDNSSH